MRIAGRKVYQANLSIFMYCIGEIFFEANYFAVRDFAVK